MTTTNLYCFAVVIVPVLVLGLRLSQGQQVCTASNTPVLLTDIKLSYPAGNISS